MSQRDTATSEAPCSQHVATFWPSGEVGAETESVTERCKCGAGPHPEHDDRCAKGHTRPGFAGPAVVVGDRSAHAQAAHRLVVDARIRELIEAKHYTLDDVPPDLRIITTHLAWAERWRAEADERIERSGGPLTSAGRERRALAVAEKWDRRVESWNREYSRYPARKEATSTLAEHFGEHQQQDQPIGG